MNPKRIGGSPPRAWGHRLLMDRQGHRLRFTPTCVGTSSRRRCACGASTVHPHVRGDIAMALRMARFFAGSPPRAWGHRDAGRLGHGRNRFTPTCVGTSPSSRPERRQAPVHPHVRGDISLPSRRMPSAAGSPPRAWGHPPEVARLDPPHRFTPTCVGTSRPGGAHRGSTAVHPHVRGDISPP